MKTMTVSYSCDLCEKPTEPVAGAQISLAHGAVCDLCASCGEAHQVLLEKMRALISAATPPQSPYQASPQQSYMDRMRQGNW